MKKLREQAKSQKAPASSTKCSSISGMEQGNFCISHKKIIEEVN